MMPTLLVTLCQFGYRQQVDLVDPRKQDLFILPDDGNGTSLKFILKQKWKRWINFNIFFRVISSLSPSIWMVHVLCHSACLSPLAYISLSPSVSEHLQQPLCSYL
jgi:hypothetical protein